MAWNTYCCYCFNIYPRNEKCECTGSLKAEIESIRAKLKELEAFRDSFDGSLGLPKGVGFIHGKEAALEFVQEIIAKLAEAEKSCSELVEALNELISVAERCDSWESFPPNALDAANQVLANHAKRMKGEE